MPPPVYSPGQVVGAADVNSWFLPLAAYKLTGTGRSSTTTRTLDPDLQLTVAANSVYEINAYLSYDTANTGGIGLAFGFTGPTGVSGQWAALYRISGDTATASGAGPVGAADFGMTQFAGSGGSWAAASTPGDGKNHSVVISGLLIVGGTGGTWGLTWAQDTSNGTALNLHIGCKLIARRVG
jgi:hypothetical protein